jgi:hypothetical protein
LRIDNWVPDACEWGAWRSSVTGDPLPDAVECLQIDLLGGRAGMNYKFW